MLALDFLWMLVKNFSLIVSSSEACAVSVLDAGFLYFTEEPRSKPTTLPSSSGNSKGEYAPRGIEQKVCEVFSMQCVIKLATVYACLE